jgi:hypothetical protein
LRQDAEGRLIIEPVKSKDLLSLLSGWDPLNEADAVPPIEDLPAEPIKF